MSPRHRSLASRMLVRWRLHGLFIWVLLLSLVLPMQPPRLVSAALATVYVRADGNDTSCNGSVDVAFASNVAPACAVRSISTGVGLVASGGTVYVAAGAYDSANGTVYISSSNFTLSGPNAAINPVTTPRNAEAVISGIAGVVFANGVSNVTVQGLKLANVSGLAFWFNGATSDVTIRNNIVDASADTAFFSYDIHQQRNLRILNNRIENIQGSSQTGIFLQQVAGGEISGNLIANVAYAGIQVDGATNLTIADNSISNVSRQGIQVANTVSANPTANVTVTGNRISNANTIQGADRGAIRLYGTAGPITVTNNSISASYNGIAIRNGSAVAGVTLRYNDISNLAGGSAIYHGGSGTVDATYNYAGGSAPTLAGSGSLIASPYLSSLALARAPAVPSGSISFVATLRDHTNAPVAGAALRYNISPAPSSQPAQGRFTTGSDGKATATLPNVANGSYTITASLAGPQWDTQPGTLNRSFLFQVRASGQARLGGRVYSQRTGVNIADAVVCLGVIDPGDQYLCQETTTTDSNGFYSFSDVPSGAWVLWVSSLPPGVSVGLIAPSRREVRVGTSDLSNLDFFEPVPHIWSKTEEVAHRGDVVSSPEDTYAGFSRAINKGASYIELDVFLSIEGNVIVAHGSTYKPAPGTIPDIPTQVYGPTPSCWDLSIETAPWSVMAECDVGTRGVGNHSVDYPRFRNERFPLLNEVLDRYPSYSGWMIELKPSERSDLNEAQKADWNRQLGQEVQNWLLSKGRTNVWVTSFSDDCLAGVTDPRIKKMRQVLVDIPGVTYPGYPNLYNRGAVWEVDNAVSRGYTALNIELGMLNKAIYPNGPTWEQYIHSNGLMVSTYKLGTHAPSNNQESIARRADFFMTDIVDDLMVQNGDRTRVHAPQILEVQPRIDTVVIRNEEIFPITATAVFTDVSGDTVLRTYSIPGLGWVEEPVALGWVRAEVTTQHASYPNVDPWFMLGKDRVIFRANGVGFPSTDGVNRAIVGTNCVAPGDPQIATDIKLRVDVSLTPQTIPDLFKVPPGVTDTWKLEAVRFYVDGELLGTGSGGTSLQLPTSGPVSRDLAAGEHTFRITYTARSPDGRTRDVVREAPFTVRLKAPDPVTGKCGDVQVAFVIDTTGSMGGAIGNIQSALTTVVNTLASKNSFRAAVVEYKDAESDAFGARVVLPLSSDTAAVSSAINSLSANGGGDTPEYVYSGVMAAVGLSWNMQLPRTIVLVGDAAPKNPESRTGYSQSSVIAAANALGIRVIVVPLASDATAPFQALADGTNGALLDANPSTIAQAILDAINNNIE